MTQSFDDWWENNYMNLSADRTEAEDIYNLGAQSRQAEVDSLEKGWVERKNERDELQKRIDRALDHTVNHGGYDDLTHIISILKGKEND